MTEPKEYFINPCCFADDVASWLINELRKQGVQTDEKPGQEDFGWYLNFEITGIGHTIVIGHRPTGHSEQGIWIGWLKRNRGFIRSLFGARKCGIHASAVEAVHKILSSSSQIRNVRWHFQHDFEKGLAERGVLLPQSPWRIKGLTEPRNSPQVASRFLPGAGCTTIIAHP
jgi:hypothetical protein